MERQQISLTQGSIWKAILLFALPIFLGQVFQQLYNTFDAWCVGYFINDNAMGAVTSSGSLIFFDGQLFQRPGHGCRGGDRPVLWC